MRKIALIFSTFFISFFNCLNAQQIMDTLNGNNVSALIYDRGRLFNNPQLGAPGYEFPAGSGNHLIYSAGFWFGGTNQSGDLKLASTGFGNYDLYRGPYSSSNSYNNVNYTNAYSSVIWNVKKADVIYHINNYNQPNYVTPNGILNWPGNGDPALGVVGQLAPYIDENNNGIYEPQFGDYPCIKGDAAVYQIMHEDLPHQESGGGKIGAEIHIMVYQYVDNSYLNNTTFIETTVYNRGQNSFNDFKTTVYMDPDIGFAEDDYIGSDPLNNLMYTYNADNFDEGGNGAVGYGTNPPALGVLSLNKDFEYMWYYNRSSISLLSDYWYSMNGKHPDGTYWTNGSSAAPVQYIYDGNPNQGTGWTELNIDGNGAANPIGDRRFVATSIEESFQPGDKLIYNYAIITNRDGNHLQNVDGLISTAIAVQDFFDTTNTYCAPNITVGLVDEFEIGKLEIYPNPALDQINIVWEDLKVNAIQITSYDGSLVKSISINSINGEKVIDISGLSPGIYFVNVGKTVRKLIVN